MSGERRRGTTSPFKVEVVAADGTRERMVVTEGLAMTPSPDDRCAVACNYVEATSIAVKGAKAYVVSPNPGWANERIEILARSRSGRWVLKWEAMKRLMIWWDDIDGLASQLEEAKVRVSRVAGDDA
jgi:hypothetical protein